MKKDTAKAVRYIVAGSILTFCVIMTGCGCGQKKKDPASEQVLKISITPEPSPTPEPDTVDASAVTANGDISMVNLYVAENPSAVSGSTAGNSDSTDTVNPSDSEASDGQDQADGTLDSSADQSGDESDESYDDSSDSQDDGSYDGSYDEDTDSEE